ncbi:MAG: DsbC family protein [Thermodesulfobacteriota bacterium]
MKKILVLHVSLFLFFFFLLSFLRPSFAFSPSGCESDCLKCHSLNNQEVKTLLKEMKVPYTEILQIQLSPVKGLWEVSIDNQGKKGLFYVDFAKKYFLPGPVIEIKTGMNKTLEQMSTLRKVDFSKIPLKTPLILGNPAASQKVAVFTDPDCPYCGYLHREMDKIIKERKDVVFYIILFPLRFHKEAYWKSKSILCQKSLKMLEDAFARKQIPKLDCDNKEVDENIKLAESLGITSTPTLIFMDGRMVTGALPAQQIIGLLLKAK